MSGITSSVGLVTGLPVQDTIDQLIQISAIPRDRLQARTEQLTEKQVAVNDLLASVISVQLSAQTLSTNDVFSDFNVSSSPADIISTTKTGTPVPGNYSFQPARLAQNQRLLSQGFSSDTDPVGSGTLSLQFGGYVDRGIGLSEINGGEGFQRGRIRITDRSGAAAEIDLRYAVNVDDVLSAINNNTSINVTASVEGDSIQLTDNTGQSTSNLIVQDIGGGTTAASLGLNGINVAASSATGNDIVSLGQSTRLSSLNNGNGVAIKSGLADFEITFRDNSAALEIDLENEQTVGDLLETLNSADPARLQAQISADGSRIELTDLTTDAGGTFAVNSLFGSAAADLGFDAPASGDTISGQRLQAGLKTALLSRLVGGQGLGELGQIQITDRSGASDTVDLSTAETLDDVIELLNSSSVNVTAGYNSSRNGISLTDTSGGSGNLVVASAADGLETAEKLQLTSNASTSTVDSEALGLQTLSATTRLAELNQGEGVAASSFLLYDSNGATGAVNIAAEELGTVGDVIDAINAVGIGIQARINDRGDGIALIDTAGGSETLRVEESGNSTAAADLGILGTAETVEIDGTPTQVIDGSTSIELEIGAEDSLDDVIANLNALDAGIQASKFFDGQQYRLSVSSQVAGRAGALLVDDSQSSFNLNTIAEARDAVVLFGDPSLPDAGLLVTSSSNTFSGLVPGVDFTLQQASDSPVNINVETTSKRVKTNIDLFVESYNKLVDKLNKYTKFESTGSGQSTRVNTGILFASNEALRVERTLTDLVGGSFGAGSIRSLSQVGIRLRDNGKLEFDEAQFDQQYAADPEAVQQFFANQEQVTDFTNPETGEPDSISNTKKGIFGRINEAIDSLAGEENSLLLNSNQAIQAQIDTNRERIERMNELLDLERDRLVTQFARLESSIQSIQSNQSALSTLQALAAQATGGGVQRSG